MKTKRHIPALLSMLCLILPLWCGCSNDMNEAMAPENTPIGKGDYSGTPIAVKAVVSGVDNFSTSTRSGNYTKETFVMPLDNNYDTGYDMTMTIEAVPPVQTRANQALINTVFRIVAYKDNVVSASNYAGEGDFITDADGNATAVQGKEMFLPAGSYTFVCYSIGADMLPDFDKSTIAIPVHHQEDFMVYKKADVNVAPDTTGEFSFGGILFTRLCSRMQIIVSIDGFANNAINACAATLSNLNDNTIIYNMSETTLPNTGTSGSWNFTWDASALGGTSANSDISYLLPSTERSLTILFTELTFGIEDLKDASFTILPQALAPGMDYKITMAISRNYIPVGGYKWAKGNVYKTDDGQFFFESKQEDFHTGMTGGSYFGWNTLETTDGACNSGAGIYNYATDPCSKVAPSGTWQTPSRVEATALSASNYTWDDTLLGAWMGTGDNKVFLPATGLRSNNGISSGGLVGVGKNAYYSLRDYTTNYNHSFIVLSSGPNWMSRMQRPNGLPIRCVKKVQ